MDVKPKEQKCLTSTSTISKQPESSAAKSFTQYLTLQLHLTSNSSASTVQEPNQLTKANPDTLSTMSGTTSGSTTNWNDVLKQTSALGILKPDLVFPSGGSSGSGSGGSSGSGGTTGGTAYPSGGVRFCLYLIKLEE